MALQPSDRVLWLCLGVTLFFAGRGIYAELQRVRDLTAIKHIEKEENIIGEATEDALNLDTLRKLSEAPSYELRAAALRIVSERSTKGGTRDLLLEDLTSRDRALRLKALNALHFLVSNRTLSRTAISARLRDLPTFTSLISCLCLFLKEHTEERNTTPSPILPRTRPPGENKALATLNIILSENLSAALEAGVVSRWLAKYPFPCAVEDESKRRNVFMHMKTSWSDDPVMSSIVNTIGSQPEGLKQLRKHGLMGSRLEELPTGGFESLIDVPAPETEVNDGIQYDDGDTDWVVEDEDTGTTPAVGWGTRPQPERTASEQARRRRRREAMVFSEGGRPLGRDDIIQPVRDSYDEDLLDGA